MYYLVSKEDRSTIGPSPVESLVEWLNTGAITYDDLIWYEGLVEWIPIKYMPEFARVESDLSETAPAAAEATVEQKQEAEEKGRLFEDYIVRRFSKKYFHLIDWRSDKKVGNRYADSNKNPDLKYEYSFGAVKGAFAVECKFRSYWSNGRGGSKFVTWCKEEQLERYHNYAKKEKLPVFIILGVGGRADTPEEVYAIPLKDIKRRFMSQKFCSQYKSTDVTKNFFFDPKTGQLTQGDTKSSY